MTKKGIPGFLLKLPGVEHMIKYSRGLVLPGFDGTSLFNVVSFFVRGLMLGRIQTRAQSLAFSFFLALFPFVIFIFTMIAYIPVEGFQEQLLATIYTLLPKETIEAVNNTIEDIVVRQRGGLLSFGFLLALYFSTNGIYALISGFNTTYHSVGTRTGFQQRIVALILTVILSLLMFFAIALIIVNRISFDFIARQEIIVSNFVVIMSQIFKWLILVSISFLGISILYYFGPANRKKWRFISAGGTLATILIILTSLGFTYFIENFGSYNKVYGSISTLIIILVYIYINSLQLIIGFELNAAIDTAKNEAREFKAVTQEMEKRNIEF